MSRTTKLLLIPFVVLLAAQANADNKSKKSNNDPPLNFEGARAEVYKTIGDVNLHLYIFEPEGHKSSDQRPAAVFFFGGGWKGGTPKQFEPHSRYLASRGMVSIVADYRVKSRQGTSPFECVKDGKSAVRWIRANAAKLGIDPDRIAAGGGSAGGHVAAATGSVPGLEENGEANPSVSTKPNALLLFNPVYDNGPGGYGHDRVKDRYKEISPFHNIRKGAPPTIVFLGTNDKLIPVSTAEKYESKMKSVGSRCDTHLYDGQPHGFFNKGRSGDKYYNATVLAMDEFLISLGWLEGEPTISAVGSKEIPIAKPETVGMSSAGLAKVDDAMDNLIKENKIPGGIVIIARRGKIVHFKSYGLADVESKKPMTNDSIQRFYSMTKSITTAAALTLYDDGKLDLDAPVDKYLPALKNLKLLKDGKMVELQSQPTVRDLARHTAGMTYGSFGDKELEKLYKEANPLSRDSDLATFIQTLGDFPLVFQPGTDWQYGVSIDVLGRVVEVVSGLPLDKYLEMRIFNPLDMRDTGFYVPAAKQDRFASCYDSDGKGNLKQRDEPSRYFNKPGLFSGGGGLVSTARDYMRFLMMVSSGGELYGTRVLSKKSVKLMTTNQVSKEAGWVTFGDQVREGVGFSLGFSVRDKMSEWDPDGRVGEYGWGGAASTHYWVSPKDDLIVITLEQVRPFTFSTELAVKGLIYDAIKE